MQISTTRFLIGFKNLEPTGMEEFFNSCISNGKY